MDDWILEPYSGYRSNIWGNNNSNWLYPKNLSIKEFTAFRIKWREYVHPSVLKKNVTKAVSDPQVDLAEFKSLLAKLDLIYYPVASDSKGSWDIKLDYKDQTVILTGESGDVKFTVKQLEDLVSALHHFQIVNPEKNDEI